jgi:hypothetical protein
MTAHVRSSDKLGEEAALADAGLAHELERGGTPAFEGRKDAIELADLLGAPDQVVGKDGHSSSTTIGQGSQIEKSGCSPDVSSAARRQARRVSQYVLHHRHEPHECGVVFASFRGHGSPLRRGVALASCRSGGHAIWWTVEAGSEEEALELLPFYVAERTTAASVSEVEIP